MSSQPRRRSSRSSHAGRIPRPARRKAGGTAARPGVPPAPGRPLSGGVGNPRRSRKGCLAVTGPAADVSSQGLPAQDRERRRGRISDSELERRERGLVDLSHPLSREEKLRAQELESAGVDRDTIALRLGWTMARVQAALRRVRACLRCGRPFFSVGIYNRTCKVCRETNARYAASVLDLIDLEPTFKSRKPRAAAGNERRGE